MFLGKTQTLLSCAVGVFMIYHILEKRPHIRNYLAEKIYTSGKIDSDEVCSEQELKELITKKYGPWEEVKNEE